MLLLLLFKLLLNFKLLFFLMLLLFDFLLFLLLLLQFFLLLLLLQQLPLLVFLHVDWLGGFVDGRSDGGCCGR